VKPRKIDNYVNILDRQSIVEEPDEEAGNYGKVSEGRPNIYCPRQ
jgi:hypothetical protein